jgi:hypothetical protein
VRHVRAVAMLLVAQGVAELGAALIVVPMMGDVLASARHQPGSSPLLALQLLVLVCGLLKVTAGWWNGQLHGRTLGYVALFSALPSAATMLCAPTGLAIMIYGLIAYGRRDGKQAFAMADARAARPLGLGRPE